MPLELDPSDRAALSRARVNLAAMRYELALILWARILLRASYDPNQPRVPAGSSEGGRWAGSDGGGGWPNVGNEQIVEKYPNQNEFHRVTSELSQILPNGLTAQQIIDKSEFDAAKPGWHYYKVGPTLICPSNLHCSVKEIADQLARFSVPGMDPSIAAEDGQTYAVSEPRTGVFAGDIRVTTFADGLVVVNRTFTRARIL